MRRTDRHLHGAMRVGQAAVAGGLVLALGACGTSESGNSEAAKDKKAAGQTAGNSATSGGKDDAVVGQDGPKKGDVPRPGDYRTKMWLPFKCGQKVMINTGAAEHAPALDMERVPQSKTTGTPLRPVAPGKVVFKDRQSGAGNVLQIKHDNGWYSTYLHLDSVQVDEGDEVARSKTIGTAGSTGTNAHDVPHLHFELAQGKTNAGRWGENHGPTVTPKFYPWGSDEFGGTSGDWPKYISHSCAAPKPTKWAKYKVAKTVNKRAWAGTKYKSLGKLRKGEKITLGCNEVRKPGGYEYRRLRGGGGADGNGAWVRFSKEYVEKLTKCG